jgi:hypothetical protein
MMPAVAIGLLRRARCALLVCSATFLVAGLAGGCGGASGESESTSASQKSTEKASVPKAVAGEQEVAPTRPESEQAKPEQASKPSRTGGASGSSSQTEIVAEKLATIEAEAPPDNVLIGQFDAALRRMEPHCKESPIEISDDTVTAQQLLAEAGISESLLSILVNVERSIPGALGKTKCFEAFAAYVTLRKSA